MCKDSKSESGYNKRYIKETTGRRKLAHAGDFSFRCLEQGHRLRLSLDSRSLV
jgi:hypothetical protein